MAASRSSRVTRSSVGLNGLDENFCGRTLRNRSIAQPEESPVSSPPPRARSPKKRQDKQEGKTDAKTSSEGEQWSASRKRAASSLEKDSDTNNKSENCEKAASHENSPQIKRARKCSRSADTQGHDEEQTVPKVKENITETNADSNGEDLSISDSSKDVIKELQEEETSAHESTMEQNKTLQLHKAHVMCSSFIYKMHSSCDVIAAKGGHTWSIKN
uniref:Uncharacterized protein n=1 Tax=Periophthalmus magnuspinnatus TaxID=409849 RepID=A0A3B4A2N3_9GOBI